MKYTGAGSLDLNTVDEVVHEKAECDEAHGSCE
jgi:hypothetical protein